MAWLTKEEVQESFEKARIADHVLKVRTSRTVRRFDWKRALSWLALPFVALGMVVVPLFGGHFCHEEAIALLSAAATIPFIGPAARALIARLKQKTPAKGHCCETSHNPPNQAETKSSVSPYGRTEV